MPHVRPFSRHDRDGLTHLVNAHVAAAIPGGAVPTSRLNGNLPSPGVYGVADAWPHIGALLDEADFFPGRVEMLFAGDLTLVEPPGQPPIEGLVVQRRVGSLGNRFDAELEGTAIGSFEVDTGLAKGGALRAMEGWADVGDLWVVDAHRGQGIGTWLFRSGCAWLRLGGFARLLAYATEREADDAAAFYRPNGLVDIGRSRRGWRRSPT